MYSIVSKGSLDKYDQLKVNSEVQIYVTLHSCNVHQCGELYLPR